MSLWKKLVMLLVVTPTLAAAQAWPLKPIRLIVPFPPGGGVDYLARVMAKDLGARLNTSVYVDNIAGANGLIGAQTAARAAPDGYTFMLTSDGPIVASPALTPSPTYSPLRDLVPVSMLAKYSCVLVAHPSFPANNVPELLAMARAKPGEITYGSAGVGNFSHLAMELLQSNAGVKMLHVPYRGTAPAVTGLLAGEINLLYTTAAVVSDTVKAGRMKILGVGDAKKLSGFPDAEPIANAVPGFVFAGWAALFAPANTPKDVVERLSKEAAAFLNDPATTKLFAQQQMVSDHMSPADLTSFIRREQNSWATLIKERGIKAE